MTTAHEMAATVWVNWVLAPLNLVDRDGGKIQNYRLYLDGGWGTPEFFAWLTSDLLYLIVIIPAAYSSQLIDFAINPATWLKPIEHAWTAVTAELFAFISPTVLLAAVLLGALMMIAIRARNADEALQDMIKRTVASLGMYMLILALLYNPAGTLLGVLTGWVRLIGDFDSDTTAVISATAPNLAEGADASVLTNFLRPLTWMLNYGSQLSPECATQWVKLINDGTPMTCLTSDQIQASQSVGIAFIMTLLALIPVWIYVRFALVIIITFATHLILAIVRFAAGALMAAASPWQDRPFDEFLRFMLSAVANLLIASGIVTLARLGPPLAVSIAEGITDSTLVHFAILVLAYYLLAQFVWALEKQFGPIRDWLLKAASNTSGGQDTSRLWAVAFPGGLNPQATALDHLISRTRQRGSQWASQTREQVSRMTNEKLQSSSATALEGATKASGAQGVLADTPQSEGAMAVINTVRTATPDDPEQAEAATQARSLLSRIMPARVAAGELDRAAATPPALTAAQHTSQTHEPTGAHANPAASPTPPPPHGANPELSQRAHWRQRLEQDSLDLTKSAALPDGFDALRLNTKAQLDTNSTLNDTRGNALDPLDTRAALAARMARISYLEIVMRAMGLDPKIDAQQLLPSGTKCFTSGQDESGNWVTEFHS